MTSGALRIGTVRGIEIRVHFTFLLVLPFLAFSFARAFIAAAVAAGVPAELLRGSAWLWGIALALALFGSVLLHELAHSLYGQRAGGQIRGITLLMIGGVSEMTEMPPRPRDEAIMALLGPAVSLAIGGASYLVHLAVPAQAFSLRFATFYLGSLNLLLGVFNLIPAYPMDGGRILRSMLTPSMGRVRATELSARLGKAIAVLFGLWGLATANMMLMLIAVFVFIGADAETRAVTLRALLGNLHVSDVMDSPPGAVPSELSVEAAADRMRQERQVCLVVTEGGRPTGMITLEAVRAVPAERRPFVAAADAAVPTPPLAPWDEATKALRLLSETALPELPVTADAHLVGTVSRTGMARVMSLSGLAAGGPPRRRAGWQQRDVPT